MPAAAPAESRPLTGNVTFLFTDIESSTRLWEVDPDAMKVAIARHDELVRDAIVGAGGYVFKTVGDAFCAAFAQAADAVAAALRAQTALATEPWPKITPIKARMALHTGAVESRDGDYFGQPIYRLARLLSVGHGGQTLLSEATSELCRDSLPEAASLRDLGGHRLRDLARPEQVFQLCHPALPGTFPPVRSLSTHPNNLPHQLTSFIGREPVIAEIEALQARTRLLTITGSGGAGKTRLALQLAADLLARFPAGAWYVELAPLSDPGLLPQTVATVLGVKEKQGQLITQTLVEHIGRKQLLLLFDNCEHLLDASAILADALLRQCPGVQILATSREALGITGEQSYRVPSLSLPAREKAVTAQSLLACESARLFSDRASLVRVDFQVTDENAPALALLCHRLDGIPLAIELAAARVRSFSVQEIENKLGQRFALLTGGSRTALPRQQTLRALVDWSYDLLTDAERLLWQRLSVFAGGWTGAAAVQVCAGEGIDAEEISDLLNALADKSVVMAENLDESPRYRLLETLRQYGRERLAESGSIGSIRERHRDCFLALAEETAPKLEGAEQAAWLSRLDEEHENLRAGLEWCLSEETSELGLRLCGTLQRFWIARGDLSEARDWCARMLARPGAGAATMARAKTLNTAGALAIYQCDYPVARERFEEVLAITRRLGDRKRMAASLNNLGVVAFEQGDFSAARAFHKESLALVRELGDRIGIANSLGNLGSAAFDQGDDEAARANFGESLALWREHGDWSNIAATLQNLGLVARNQGDLAAAGTMLEEALAIARKLGDRGGVSRSLGGLATVAVDRGEHTAARRFDRERLAISIDLGDRRGTAGALECAAEIAAALGNAAGAARFWGAAERLREEIGSPQPPRELSDYDQRVVAARAALGNDDAFDRAWAEGRAWTLEYAIERAMEDTADNG